MVEVLTGQDITVEFDRPAPLQIDGETILDSMLKKCQTQDVGDLAQQLIDMIQKIHKGTWSDVSFDALRMIAENPDGKWAHYTQRLIRENDPYILKTSLTNAAYEGGFRGYQTAQENAAKYDINVPWLILMDPTSACNMHCTGCWAAEYGHKQSLTFEEMGRVLTEAKALGTHACLFTGGEPLLRKKDIIHLCEKHRDMAFHAITNGTLIDEEFCQEMLRRHENSSGHWGFLRRAICRSYPAGSGPPAERGFRGLICYIKQREGRNATAH